MLAVNFNCSDSEITDCDYVGSNHAMGGKLNSQLIPDETLNGTIESGYILIIDINLA